MMRHTTGPPPRAGPAVRMGDYPQFSWRTTRQTSPASRALVNPMPSQPTRTGISARSAVSRIIRDPAEPLTVDRLAALRPASAARPAPPGRWTRSRWVGPRAGNPGHGPFAGGGRSRIRTWEGEADGFTDPWRNNSELCERHREALFRHALDMIMLRCPADGGRLLRRPRSQRSGQPLRYSITS